MQEATSLRLLPTCWHGGEEEERKVAKVLLGDKRHVKVGLVEVQGLDWVLHSQHRLSQCVVLDIASDDLNPENRGAQCNAQLPAGCMGHFVSVPVSIRVQSKRQALHATLVWLLLLNQGTRNHPVRSCTLLCVFNK